MTHEYDIYTPGDPAIFDAGELQQAIDILKELHEDVRIGKITQFASPALLIAIDCVTAQLQKVNGG